MALTINDPAPEKLNVLLDVLDLSVILEKAKSASMSIELQGAKGQFRL